MPNPRVLPNGNESKEEEEKACVDAQKHRTLYSDTPINYISSLVSELLCIVWSQTLLNLLRKRLHQHDPCCCIAPVTWSTVKKVSH